MRTQEEILERIKERKPKDFFNFEIKEYIATLTFENAEQFLKEGTTKENWRETTEEATENEIKTLAINYMSFAWEKANNCRGISASRSISHYIAWMWLLGYDDTERWENYEYYGKLQLIEICNLLDLDHTQWDDGIRKNKST